MTMTISTGLKALALGASLLALSVPAFAAGETAPAKTAESAPDPWVAKWGDLGEAYTAAKALAEAGKYEEAIAAMTALNKPEDPRVLNWLGFSTRKMGNADAALVFYDKALTIAPEYTPAHEYRGEAYLQKKDMEKAKAELAEIAKLCGNMECEEYKDLNKDIMAAAGS